jgi:hypothetical protein
MEQLTPFFPSYNFGKDIQRSRKDQVKQKAGGSGKWNCISLCVPLLRIWSRGIFVFVVIQRLASSLTASWDISKSSTRAAYQVPL